MGDFYKPHDTGPGWYGVRTVYRFDGAALDGRSTYEERITIWQARDMENAFQLAEDEAKEYVDILSTEATPCIFLGLYQAYFIADEMGHGAEVYSLMRDSLLEPEEYLSRFFDTGDERVRREGD